MLLKFVYYCIKTFDIFLGLNDDDSKMSFFRFITIPIQILFLIFISLFIGFYQIISSVISKFKN